MAGIVFDDLIPQGGPASSGGPTQLSFDDLIPKPVDPTKDLGSTSSEPSPGPTEADQGGQPEQTAAPQPPQVAPTPAPLQPAQATAPAPETPPKDYLGQSTEAGPPVFGSSPSKIGEPTATAAPSPPVDESASSGPGALKRGFMSAFASQNPQMVGKALEGFGEIFNSQKTIDLGKEITAKADQWGKGYEPQVPSFRNIPGKGVLDTAGRALTYAGEMAGQGIGSSLPSLITGLATSVVTANPVVGLALGAAAPSYIQNYGDVYGSLQDDEGVKARIAAGELSDRDLAKISAIAAVPVAALDVVSLENIAKPLTQEAKHQAEQAIVKAIITHMAKAGAGEAVTEGLQQVIEEATESVVGKTPFLTWDRVSSVIDNMMGGLFGGGLMGGSTEGLHQAGRAFRQPPTEPKERVEPTLPTAPLQPGDAESPLPKDLLGEGRAILDAVGRGEPLPDLKQPAQQPGPPVMQPGGAIVQSPTEATSDQENIGGLPGGSGLNGPQLRNLPNQEAGGGPNGPNGNVQVDEGQRQGQGLRRQEVGPVAPLLRANGEPFKTEAEARLAANSRRDLRGKGYRPVEVNGGWGLQGQQPAETARAASTPTPVAGSSSPAAGEPSMHLPHTDEGLGTAKSPVQIRSAVDMAPIRERIHTNPSDGQKDAGNYALGHGVWNGIPLAFETAKGGVRRSKADAAVPWEVPNHPTDYGYAKTEAIGKDGDKIDVHMGPNPESENVFAIDQYDPAHQAFDEHKFMLGFNSKREAEAAYDRAFTDGKGPQRRLDTTEMSVDQFKEWLKRGDTKAPIAGARLPVPPQKTMMTGDELEQERARLPKGYRLEVNEDGYDLYHKGKAIAGGSSNDRDAIRKVVDYELSRPENHGAAEQPSTGPHYKGIPVDKPGGQLTDEELARITEPDGRSMDQRNAELSKYESDPRFMVPATNSAGQRIGIGGMPGIRTDFKLVRDYLRDGSLTKYGKTVDQFIKLAESLAIDQGKRLAPGAPGKLVQRAISAATTGRYNDGLHPDNTIGRKVFEALTNQKLPKGVKATEQFFQRKPFLDESLRGELEQADEEAEKKFKVGSVVKDERGRRYRVREVNGSRIILGDPMEFIDPKHFDKDMKLPAQAWQLTPADEPVVKGSLGEDFEEASKAADAANLASKKKLEDAGYTVTVTNRRPLSGETNHGELGKRPAVQSLNVTVPGKKPETARVYHWKDHLYVEGRAEEGGTASQATLAKIQALLEGKEAPAQEAEKPKAKKLEKSQWSEIGKNAIGQTIYEDQRGVRSYIENGVRITEPVAYVPGKGMELKRDGEGEPQDKSYRVVDRFGQAAPADMTTNSYETRGEDKAFGKFKGFARTNEGGFNSVHAYGETAAEAQKNATDKLLASLKKKGETANAPAKAESHPQALTEAQIQERAKELPEGYSFRMKGKDQVQLRGPNGTEGTGGAHTPGIDNMIEIARNRANPEGEREKRQAGNVTEAQIKEINKTLPLGYQFRHTGGALVALYKNGYYIGDFSPDAKALEQEAARRRRDDPDGKLVPAGRKVLDKVKERTGPLPERPGRLPGAEYPGPYDHLAKDRASLVKELVENKIAAAHDQIVYSVGDLGHSIGASYRTADAWRPVPGIPEVPYTDKKSEAAARKQVAEAIGERVFKGQDESRYDFEKTFPQPLPEKVAALEKEGRSPFDEAAGSIQEQSDDSTREIINDLIEDMNSIAAMRDAIVRGVDAKTGKKIPANRLEQVRTDYARNIDGEQNHLEGTLDHYEDIYGHEARRELELHLGIEGKEAEEAQAPSGADYGTKNKIFTKDAADKAREILRKKLSQASANPGLDPELMQAGLSLAGYHIEAGARSFAAFTKAMIKELGENIRPFLRAFYEGVRHYPGFETKGMTPPEEIESQAKQADIAATEANREPTRTEPLGDAGDRSLETVPAGPVRGTQGERQAGERGEKRGPANVERPGTGNEQWPLARRGVGEGETAVPVSARGEEPGSERGRAADVHGAPGDGRAAAARDAGRSDLNPVERSDFIITDDHRIGQGGEGRKFSDNIAAIKLIKELTEGNRLATPEEQQVLARYVGWGGLKSAFPRSGGSYNKGWEGKGAQLKALLTQEEWENARRTVLDAHYTAIGVVRAMHDILRAAGFEGGAVLEPSMGIGNFFGAMPIDIRSRSELTGVEFDNTTGAIAKQLYQSANILAPMGFQDAPLADGYFDVAIGNPPFGNQRVPGAREKDIKGFSIHNYFFARTINKLRPGGVMAMVVTRSFLDKGADAERQYIADRAKFVGAIRLPNTAFLENARTAVTTDIVVLQKLAEGEAAPNDAAWTKVGEIEDPLGGPAIPLNQYFIDHPEMMLGRMERSGQMREANEPTLAADERDLDQALTDAVRKLMPERIYEPSTTARPTADMVRDTAKAPEVTDEYDVGSYFADGNKLWRREMSPDGSARAIEITPDTQWSEKQTLGKARYDRLKGLVDVRNSARKVLSLEAEDASKMQIDLARKNLNKVYDKFVEKHGYLSDRANELVFRDDPEAPLLLALENNYDAGISPARAKTLGVDPREASAEKAAIFSKRVIQPYKPVLHADNPRDALSISLSDMGEVNVQHMANLLGKGWTADMVTKALHDDLEEPLIYQNPATDRWETAAEYLSGNVKQKAKEADRAGLGRNAKALRAVFPADLKAGDIRVRPGASWVKGDYYRDFARHLFGDDTFASVAYMPSSGGFFVDIKPGSITNATAKWGTEALPGHKLLDLLLNNKEIVVRDKTPDGAYIVDKESTQAALDKANEIKNEFTDWLMRDQDRREDLTKFYNDNFNTNVEPKFDGSHLTLPGKVPDDIIKLRRHQINAVWRGVSQGKALLDHVVGAGKTFTMAAIAMERRRMGLSKKPMLAVPNHLVEQWASDFYRLYPGAKLLTMTKADFSAQNRKRMLARIATGDWDAVITAHSSFGFMRMSHEYEGRFIQKQIDEIQSSIDTLRKVEGKKDRRVADFVRSIDKLKAKLKELSDKPKDDLLNFEELGVDQLLVDEAHEFKNLYFTTARRGMLGLGNPQGSKKAFDLFMKTRWLQEKLAGKGVIFATGTPISNSLTEMYTLQRYLGLEELEHRGILSFDAWLNNFGNDYSDYELDGTGVKYKAVNRLRALTNVPEVMAMYRQYADSVTLDQIKDAYRQDNPGKEFPIPKVKGGKRQNIVVPRSDAQAGYFDKIVERASNLKAGDKDNMLAITMDARKAALDMRLVDPSEGDNPVSKVHEAADEIADRWRQWADDRGTQLVFLDLSIPLSAGKKIANEAGRLIKNVEDARAKIHDLVQSEASQEKIENAEQELMDAEEELSKKYSTDDLIALHASRAGFSVYDDLKQKLIDRGIPEKEIAFIHDYDTDTKKADLFDKVNAGNIRVLLGSTTKMGAGTNVQQRAVAEHHLDCPWRPSDIEQREGRVVRQGNSLYAKYGDKFEVELLAYATERTYDARMWQTQEQKLLGIEGLRNYKGEREMEEVTAAAASAAEMKAVATGNPLILEDVQLADKIRKLETSERAHRRTQYDLESDRKKYRQVLEEVPDQIADYEADAKKAEDYLADPFKGKPPTVTINNETYTKHQDAIDAMRTEYDRQREAAGVERGEKFPFSIDIDGQNYTSLTRGEDAIFSVTGGARPINITLNGKEFKSPGVAAKAMKDENEGQIGGIPFEINIDYFPDDKRYQATVRLKAQAGTYSDVSTSDDRQQAGRGALRELSGLMGHVARAIDEQKYMLEKAKRELPSVEAEVGNPFAKAEELAAARKRHAEVRKLLSETDNPKEVPAPTEATTEGEEPQGMLSLRRRQPRSLGIPHDATIVSTFDSDVQMKAHPEYKAAKAGNIEAAAKLVNDLVGDDKLEQAREKFGPDVTYVPVIAEEASGHNMIPTMLAELYAQATGAQSTDAIHQASRAFHTGARPLERIMSRPVFDGTVEPGKRYVLVDDATVMGGTLAELANHIRSRGGEVAGLVSLVNASRTGVYTPKKLHLQAIEARFGDEIRKLGIEPSALTANEAQYLSGFRNADELRGAIAKAKSERSARLLSKGIRVPEAEGEGQLKLGREARVEPTPKFAGADLNTLTQDLTDRLRAMDPRGRIALRVVEKIREMADGQLAAADGRYLGRLIEIALDADEKGWVLDHETIHALRDLGVIRPDEWAALKKSALSNQARMDYVRHAYEDVYKERFPNEWEDKVLEEAVADMFADWRAGRLDATGFARSAWQRVREFFRALGDWFRGKGFNTPEQVFKRVASGEVGAREERAAPAPEIAPAPPTGSTAFKRWFGKSKVVDENGRPLVVYHGSKRADLDHFQPLTFFADRDVANSYAEERGHDYTTGEYNGSTVYPSYLSIEHPATEADIEAAAEAVGEADEGIPAYDYLSPAVRDDGAAKVMAELKGRGFDGAIIDNDFGMHDERQPVTSYVIFDAAQAKSAFNQGAFDRANPDSMYGRFFGKDKTEAKPAPEPEGPTTKKVGIKADLKGIMSVLGPKLYDADMPRVTVKELLQNAWDGIKSATATERLKPGDGHINIKVDEESRSITVTDNGAGMTPKIVEDALLTIAGTSKDGLLPGERSGGFGIAKMGSILAGDRMRLVTVRDGVKTTLDTTRDELMSGNATLKSEKTTDPNGTSIEIFVPETVTAASGEQSKLDLPTREYSYPILQAPLLGDVGVDFTRRAKDWKGEKYEEQTAPLDLGRRQNLTGISKITTAHFPWGDVDIYMSDKKEAGWNKHQVLSSGVHQFDAPVTVAPLTHESIPHRFIFNVKPSVEAHAANYPFNNQRENWANAVQGDLEPMRNYLRNLYNSRKANEVKLGFADVQKMPKVRQNLDVDQVRGGKKDYAFEDAGFRDRLPAPPKQLQPVPDITIKDGKRTGGPIGWEAAGDATAEPVKIEEMSVPREYLDVSQPYFHNGLNVDLIQRAAQISNVPEHALRYFVARFGTIVHQFADGLSKVPAYRAYATEPRPVGISFAKRYQGINVKVPFKGFFLQPFGQFAENIKSNSALASLYRHIMIHEAVHENISGHNENFTSAEAALYAQYDEHAGDNALGDIETQVRKLLEEHRDAYDALNRAYYEPTTLDAPGATEGGQAAAVRPGAEGDTSVPRAGDETGQPARGSSRSNLDAQEAGRGGEPQGADLRSVAFKRWFGDSKVVDENGKPLVVYHGTYTNITEFNAQRWDGVGGIYFTDKRGVAEEYARMAAATDGDEPRVVSAYLSIKNPKRMRDTQLYDLRDATIAAMKRQGFDGVFGVDADGKINEYIAFDPTQIKRVDNRGTFDASNPNSMLSLRRGTVTQERAINKAIAPRDERTLGQRIAESYKQIKENFSDEFTWAVADEFHGLRKMGKTLMPKAADRELGSYVGARLARHAAGQIEAFLRWGAPLWNDESAVLEHDNTGGLFGAVEPVYRNGLERMFDGYAYARRVRTQNLIETEREKNLTHSEVDDLLALGDEHPEIREAFDKLQAYKKKVLDAVEGMGLINHDQRQVWEQADHVPFYRARLEEEAPTSGPNKKRGLANQGPGIRRLTGEGETYAVFHDDTGQAVARFATEAEARADAARRGEGYSVEAAGEPIVGVVENLARNITHLIDAAMKNHAATMAIDEALELGWAAKEPMEITQAHVPFSAMARALRSAGFNIEQGGPNGMAAVMAIAPPVKPNGNVISIRREGKTEYYRVDDPLVLRALAGLYRTQMSSFVRPLAAIKNILTRSVTAMPGFMARNFVRDSAASWLISEERGVNFVGEMAKSLGALGKSMKDPRVQAMMAAGGDTGWYQNAPEDVVKQLRQMEKEGNATILHYANPKALFHAYEKLGRASELANRLVTFESEMNRSGNARQAAFSSADLLDFQLKGGSDFIQFMTQIVPFLNARIQGLYKLGRAGLSKNKAERKMFAAKATMMLAFSLALMALNAGDKDDGGYNDMPEWMKDGSWVINNHRLFGKEIAQRVGLPRFFLIPKPFELGVLFGTMPERIVQLIAGNDRAQDTWRSVYTALLSTFEFDPFGNPVTKEIMEQWANKDLFTGNPIVSESLSRLPAEQQYTPDTSQVARWLGDKLGMSPERIEHAVRGFTGTAGAYMMAAVDATARALGVAPARPTQRPDQMEIIRSFMADDPALGSKWLERFYQLHAQAEGIYEAARARQKEGDSKGANQMAKENRHLLAVRQPLDTISNELAKIRVEMKRINQSGTMSPDEKRERLDKLLVQQHRLAKMAASRGEAIAGKD